MARFLSFCLISSVILFCSSNAEDKKPPKRLDWEFEATPNVVNKTSAANTCKHYFEVPGKKLQMHTTHSWDFMGFKNRKRTKRNPSVESNVVIGVIDGGITPESKSFSGKGFGPPPHTWKGVCSGGGNFTCNNKLIGARDYTGEGTRDINGHGTMSASTAAGNVVADVSFLGLGYGTARGGVPAARIAAYKVCSAEDCSRDAILNAFEDAIADGVDIITISLGGEAATNFDNDTIAIGAFRAMMNGILTVNSAGNNGPEAGTVLSVAPWILTVAASSTNRGFVTKVVLENGETLVGRSVNGFDRKGKKYPLVYGKSAANASSGCEAEHAESCYGRCLDSSLIKGKVLVCGTDIDPSGVAASLGAIAVIFIDSESGMASVRALPASVLSEKDFKSLVSYIESTDSPKAAVLKSEAIFNQTTAVASFSSRGPNTIAVDILKPDITAPGVEILSAYSPYNSPSDRDFDKRRVKFSVSSGTSIACPHVAGVAAYVKTFHPQWSPSMIQSAIMTTAWPMNASGTGFVSTEFAYGAGHVDPLAAVNPGLVYETTKADHIAFLCGLNYTTKQLRIITKDNSTCTKRLSKTLSRNLNYPTMSAKVSATGPFRVTFKRTVTNVGTLKSTYKAKVVTSSGSSKKLRIKVSPNVLSLKSMNEKQTFVVTVSGYGLGTKQLESAYLIWSDGSHNIRSPIVIYAMS